jgi:hypothetical protein
MYVVVLFNDEGYFDPEENDVIGPFVKQADAEKWVRDRFRIGPGNPTVTISGSLEFSIEKLESPADYQLAEWRSERRR